MLLRAPWRIVPIVSAPPYLHVRDATMKTNDMNSIWVAMRWAIYRWLPGLMIALVLAELGLIRAGAWHATDNYMALAGYVPYSDAQDYLVGAFDQAYGGRWNWIASTRPLAAAFRQVTVLAGGHVYFYTLIVQAVLVGSSLALAARAVTRWHGPFSGLFFIALSALMICPFVATTMTELLALTWSFAGVAFLLDAAHLRSKAHFVVAVALFILALMTRMGAMLLISALILWGAFALGSTRSERAKVAAACIAVALGIWAVNAALSFLFGAHDANTGANFTYVACGLARGTNYQECLDAFADQLRPLMNDPTAVSAFLIRQTYEMILSIYRHFSGSSGPILSDFILDFPRLLLGGYGNPFDLTDNQTVVILVALLPGFLWAAWRATNAVRMLWLLVFLEHCGLLGNRVRRRRMARPLREPPSPGMPVFIWACDTGPRCPASLAARRLCHGRFADGVFCCSSAQPVPPAKRRKFLRRFAADRNRARCRRRALADRLCCRRG